MKNPLRWLTRAYSPPPMTWESVFGLDRTPLSGVSVSEYSALHYSPVWAGVTTLARDIAKLPLPLWRNLPNGGKERFTSHPLYRILHDEANPEMTSFKFRETMQALCLLYGNAYAEILRTTGTNRPVGMYPIVPSRVTPFREDRSGTLRYRVTNPNGGQSIVMPADMIHLSSLSTDGVIGHSLTEHANESIGLGVALERFGGSFFGQGSTFGGVVEVPGAMTEDAKKNLRSLIEAVHAGVDRAHRILVLANGSKFTPRGTAPNEAQFIETRKFQITETARWLNMPPHKLGDLENAHFTNIEEQEIQYYVGTVSGWLKMWEQELTRKLISPLEYSQQTIEHVLEGVLRGDSTKRAAFYDTMVKLGAFSINDVLRKENMNPIPDGDQHLVPLNMVPIERYGEYLDKLLAATPVPTPPALPPASDPNATRAVEALTDEVKNLILRDTEREQTLEQRARDAEAARLKGEQDAALYAQQVTDATTRLRDAETRAADAAYETATAQAAARAEVAAAEAVLAARETALADAERARDAAARSAADLTTRADALAATLQARKETELDRLTRVVAAHRALLVHAVEGLLIPEVDRARKRQATPESLRKWVDAFYVTHRDVCAAELYPAVLTHLAWKRSDDDPRVVARALADAHCDQSVRDLRAVLDGTDGPDDFHVVLERVLTRWEQERPHAVADGVLADELTYIRAFQ